MKLTKKLNIPRQTLSLSVSCFLLFVSCSGYKPFYNNNPFKKYGIKHISIPIFFNKSIIPNINTQLTVAIGKSLLSYKKLQISFGLKKSADSILIGIITSNKRQSNVFTPLNNVYIDKNAYGSSIQNRKSFYLPTTISYKAVLTLYLIKKPFNLNQENLNILTGGVFGKSQIFTQKKRLEIIKKIKPNFVFSHSIALNGTYNMPLKASGSATSGGVTNFSNSQGNFRDSINLLAINVAKEFKRFLNGQ